MEPPPLLAQAETHAARKRGSQNRMGQTMPFPFFVCNERRWACAGGPAPRKGRMADPKLDVVAVGAALVDILHTADDAFLQAHAIPKGTMALIDEERALYLTALFDDALETAGGSAGNTVTGVASFGGRAGFIGKTADDALGRSYAKSFHDLGAAFSTTPLKGPPGTGRCLIVVTPDGERSMSTYLGASGLVEPGDIDRALVESAAITFLEGYLFDREEAKAAFVHAAEIARGAGRKVSVTLSDVFCVDRHRASFKHLVANHIDILFANEGELLSLYETDNFEAALETARAACPLVAVTRGEKGSVIAAGPETYHVAAAPVANVIDTTGAGDLYAAGFLFGYANHRPLPECGALGSLAASEVISHMGPRPEVSLKALMAARG
jgi:sugar/nucleoside kinase (ribokinase family)